MLLADLDALLQEELDTVKEPREVALTASLEVHQPSDEVVESVVTVERLSAIEEFGLPLEVGPDGVQVPAAAVPHPLGQVGAVLAGAIVKHIS